MPVRSFGALGAGVCILLCAPVVCAQAPREAAEAEPRGRISVRELSIPESARKNYARSREELIEKQQPECAIGHLRKAIDEFPDYYEAWYLLGVAHITLGQPEQAEAALRKSVSLSAERFPQPFIALATMFADRGRFAEAEPLAAQAVELDDSAWYAHYELARARLGLNRPDEALASARLVVREQPDYARGRLLLAMTHARRREFGEAQVHLDTYLRLEPEGPARARMLALRDEMARAAAAVQATIAASPPD